MLILQVFLANINPIAPVPIVLSVQTFSITHGAQKKKGGWHFTLTSSFSVKCLLREQVNSDTGDLV